MSAEKEKNWPCFKANASGKLFMKGPGGLSLWMWSPPSPTPPIPPVTSEICVGATPPWQRLSKGVGNLPPLALEFATAGGRQKIQCWNTEGIFRLIQSIPSPKAEPFKRWLARVGKERIDEIENPELAMGRIQELYEKKGYHKEWIDKRLRGIAVRQDLTDEWKDRGARTTSEYAILTSRGDSEKWKKRGLGERALLDVKRNRCR